jgi:long-chain acyl-CoA synthetase
MNLAELALKSQELGEHVSYIFEGHEITNMQMDRVARRLGNALKKLGVEKGDRVMLQIPNCPEVLQAFQAIWRIGGIAVPINYQFNADDISYVYEDSGADTVISSPEYLEKVRAAQARVPAVRNVILVSPSPYEGTLHFQKLVDESSEDLGIEQTADDDVAALIYTSGTTGRPKGVMLTHYGIYYTAKMGQETNDLPQDLISLAVLPLCHVFGLTLMVGAFLRLKGKVVILRQFNLEKVFSAIDKYKVQSMPGVPTMYVYMLLFPDAKKYDISSVRIWVSGSAPLSLETWKQFKEKFGGEIAEGWGLTEGGSNNTSSAHVPKKPGSIGVPQKGMEMKVFDARGNEVPQGEEGELVLRGPMVMKGYWKQPEATAEVIRDGWLYTGDVGYVDKDGYFFITDRKKDIIIKGGENISPRKIEEALMAHSKVGEAAVIGIKDKVYGEDIKGFVVLKPDQTATPEEILDYCKANLSKFLVPKEIAILTAFPKTVVGKILKKELRNLH